MIANLYPEGDLGVYAAELKTFLQHCDNKICNPLCRDELSVVHNCYVIT